MFISVQISSPLFHVISKDTSYPGMQWHANVQLIGHLLLVHIKHMPLMLGISIVCVITQELSTKHRSSSRIIMQEVTKEQWKLI
jgi:hypothetical protein